ncbi:regulatory protein, luxR family [Serratia sp. JKS296]|uniref:response regulator transcription factor n=1 Tax=Serratia sp. JKS296 TaxID=1938824 RepID=UPI000BD7163C|nr:helix-turn-helix transcriptional regulator [Serratia sp. JKS296]SOD79461.1 regulatory protein, luxR family [Serratia sp. JKS296]
MRYHIISDDNFFLLGCKEIFEQSACMINCLRFDSQWIRYMIDHVDKGDIVMVNMSTHIKKHLILERISFIGAVAIPFIEIPRNKTSTPSWMEHFISTSMPVEELISHVNEIHENKTRNSKRHFLSKREIEIMGELLNGCSIYDLSKKLNVAKKTIYSHRRNALIKIGASSHYYYIVKYKDHILPRRFRSWLS